VTFIDFTPTQDWCKHMPYKRFAEAIIMASKKYKIAYRKKRSGWAEDIFKWEHTLSRVVTQRTSPYGEVLRKQPESPKVSQDHHQDNIIVS
jgi:hypothetical protein